MAIYRGDKTGMKNKIPFENSIWKNVRLLDVLFVCAVICLGLYARVNLFYYESQDYRDCLQRWMGFMAEDGGLISLKYKITNYTTPYTLFLTILTYIPYSGKFLIKMLSCGFDVLLMLGVGYMVWKWTNHMGKAIVSGLTVFMMPTIIINSAAWAQCDAIYCFFLLGAFYFMVQNKSFVSMLFYAVAFSLKLQSIFLIPVVVLALCLRKIRYRDLIWPPIIYVLSNMPAVIAGRPFKEVMLIYFEQTEAFSELTKNYPNLYYFLGVTSSEAFGKMGLAVAATIVGVLLYFTIQVVIERRNAGGIESLQSAISLEELLQFTCVTAGIMLYLLPHMHERYGYIVSLLLVVYAFIKPQKWFFAVTWEIITLMSYFPFITGSTAFPFTIQAGIQLVLVVALCVDYVRGMCKEA